MRSLAAALTTATACCRASVTVCRRSCRQSRTQQRVSWPGRGSMTASHQCWVNLLPLGQRIIVKLTTIIFKCLHGSAPSYLYDTIEEFNVDSKAEYSALSSTRSQKLKQTKPVPLIFSTVSVKAVQRKSDYEGKDLWKRWVISLEWKVEGW